MSPYNDWKLGDEFGIVLSKEGNERHSAASVTDAGGIIIYPSLWFRVSFEKIVEIVSHETDHIGIGQFEGVNATNRYDRVTKHIWGASL